MSSKYRWFHFVEAGSRTHLVGWEPSKQKWVFVCGLYTSHHRHPSDCPTRPLCLTCSKLSDLQVTADA